MKQNRSNWMAGGTVVVCILAIIFALFVIGSSEKIVAQADQMYEHPYQVKGEALAFRTRLTEMEMYLTSLLMSDLEHPETMWRLLAERDGRQDASLAVIRERYLGPPEDVEDLYNALAALRQARLKAVEVCCNSSMSVVAVADYVEREVNPYSDATDAVLERIIQHADGRVAEILYTAQSARRTTEAGAVLICVLIIAMAAYTSASAKRKNKELAYREKLFDLVTTNIDDVFLVYNHLEKKGEYVSDNCERVLGIEARAFEQDINLFRSRLTRESLATLEEVLGPGLFKEAAECDLKFRQSTRLLDIRLRIYPIYVDKKLIQCIAVISDQTQIAAQQTALNEALISAQKANEAKRGFLSRMSHEIRTPMNAIIGMTAIAMKHLHDEERVGDCLGKIAYSSKHLLSLINDVLDMSKIDDGKLLVNNQRFNLQKLVESITSIVYAQAKENNLHYKVRVTDLTDEFLIGDELRVNQVLLNLLSNAIKFTPEGGEVTLEISQQRKKNDRISIRFIVRDTGIGMNDEFMDRLYTPFEQADGSIFRRFGGTGLGMSITKNLVSIMEGSIAVESEEGRGTTFTVDIPFGVTEQNRFSSYSELDNLKMIVVDNDQDTCEHAILLLDQMGVTTHWAYSGMEAVEKVVQAHKQGAKYDVCFIDWCMPDMDGVETTRRIRQEIGPDTLIIIISAYDWSIIEKEAREAGANAFVSKPFFASTLYNTLISVGSAPAAVPVQKEVNYNFIGKKILLAEDNEINKEIALAILRETGVEVDTAEDGRKAVDCYEQSVPGEYALILMDIQMPYMDGYEATRIIRNSSHGDAGTIPIFAMTANAFNEDVAASWEAGMNGHLSKPIDVQTLYRTIAPYLN